jgi:glycine oxidase
MRIGIAGAGLLGRLLAFQLVCAGHTVTVLDPAAGPEQRGAAGWTAAGMLSPMAELETANLTVFEQGVRSLDLWAGIVTELAKVAPDHPVMLKQQGSLLLAHKGDEGTAKRMIDLLAHKMQQHPAPIQYAGHAPQLLSSVALRCTEPSIHSTHTAGSAWLLPIEGQIDTVEAMTALTTAATALGVTWHWGESVTSLAQGRIQTNTDSHAFDWVFDVRGTGARPDLAVRGVRGEIFWLHAPGVQLERPIRLLHPRHRVYLVPRSGHRIVVGASEIESEDRSPISLRSTVELLAAAHSVMPELAEARIIHSETNLRPALLDNLPCLVTQDGLTRINGLFRHGWLIAPALVEDAIAAMEKPAPFKSRYHMTTIATTTTTINLTVNGISRQEPSGISLAELIASLGHAPQSLATAVNQVFVPKTQRDVRVLVNGDAVFTFQPITGG